MKFYDPEKVKQLTPIKRKKFLMYFGGYILLNLALVVGFIPFKISLHQSLDTPACIFAFIVSGVSLVGCASFWLIYWTAFRKIAYLGK